MSGIKQRPDLRDCPFCHATGEDNILLTKEVQIASDDEYELSYSVRCIQCGVAVHEEYQDQVCNVWNGLPAIDYGEDDAA